MKYEEIQEKLKIITSMEPKPIPDSEMMKITKIIENKTPKSKEFYNRIKECIPGGVQHMLVIKDPYPTTINKSLGTRMWDVDENEYIDWLMGAGSCILGHSYPPLRKELIKVMMEVDSNTVWNSEWEVLAVESVKKHYPTVERVKYFQSGTEANMAAIRIARAYTGKSKIIKFGGSYHGWSDQLTYDMHVPYSGSLESIGIPSGCFKDLISLGPNDLEGLEQNLKKWNERKAGVAAVLLEPLGGESGAIPIKEDFNRAVRDLCDKHEALLIFDEVVTGFRLDIGGAQKYFGVKPDMTVFGKILTHGFPSAGAVGGRAELMKILTPNPEESVGKKPFASGTLLGNPLSSAATYWTIKFLEETDCVNKAAAAADDLTKKLNDLFEQDERPFFAYNYKSILHFETYCPVAMDVRIPENVAKAVFRKSCVDRIATALFSQGIITKYGNRGFCCLSHSKEDNNKFIEAFRNVLKLIPK